MQIARRLLGEVIVLLMAIALAVGVADLAGPREFPETGSQFAGEKRTQFYNRLIVGQVAFLVAWIILYYVLHKLYTRWRDQNAARGSTGPDNQPLEQTGR